MNKILIVGHESSHYQDLEQILYTYGMAQAIPSHTYRMTPIELGAKLLLQSSSVKKTYPSKNIDKNNQSNIANGVNSLYHQKKPKKIWDNLAFDLFLSNINQSLWGWSDNNAINLLEYWANFDDDIGFILVYDKPNYIIQNLLNNNNNLNQDELTILSSIEKNLNIWLQYNQAILDFYYKYPTRCLLVNGEQVTYAHQSYIESVSNKITSKIEPLPSEGNNINYTPIVSSTTDFLIQQILNQDYQNYVSFFETLQKSSDISLLDSQTKTNKSHISLLKEIIKKQSDLNLNYKEILTYKKELKIKQDKLANIEFLLKDKNKKEKSIQQELLKEKKSHLESKDSLKNLQNQIIKYQEDNKILIKNLYQVQEKLEEIYLDNANMEFKFNIIKSDLKSQKNENKQLLKQLLQTQEEIENLYLKTIKDKDSIYYGSAARIKQDLPYRLGAVMINNSKSIIGLIQMPFLLRKEFKKDNSQEKNLPPIEAYKDIHEAEKVKQHLSYQLGEVIINNSTSLRGVLTLPFKIRKIVIQFKKERKNKNK